MAILCRKLSLLFLCVPKTGCSAVAEALTSGADGEWFPPADVFDTQGNVNIGRKHATWQQLVQHGLLTSADVERLTTFATVRNPFDWVVSTYFYWRWLSELEAPESQLYWVRAFASRMRLAATGSFSDYVRSVYGETSASVISRWREPWVQVIRFEELQDGVNAVLRSVGVAGGLSLTAVNVAPGRVRDYRGYYDAETIGIVERAFRDDCQRYGYAFE